MNNKGSAVLLGLLAVIVLGSVGGGYWYATKSYTRTAFLNVESEAVQVDTGAGWQSAKDGMDLGLDDKVKTEDGVASVVIYESVIVALDPGSEVTIKDLNKEHVKVTHDSGSAWHKFTGLTGIEAFSVETPATVATVRGTEFETTMESVRVSEGKVEVVTKDGKTFLIEGGYKLMQVGDEWVKVPLTKADKADLIAQMNLTVDRLRKLRWAEIMKKETLYNTVKALYGLTDDDVQVYLADADAGEYDLNEAEAMSPVKSEVVGKIKAITLEIIEQLNAIALLEAMPVA